MPTDSPDIWQDHLRTALSGYDDDLLRHVATRLARIRNQWPAPELIDRCEAALGNPATIDRRLAELPPLCRQLLEPMGYTRDFRLSVGDLVELAMAQGAQDATEPIVALLETGFLFPQLDGRGRLKDFRHALFNAASHCHFLFTLPLICSRARAAGTMDVRATEPASQPADSHHHVHQADGLEWLLRLAALHQTVSQAPLRRTQNGDFFKRDRERLAQDVLLNHPPSDVALPIPDLPFFIVSLAEAEGIVRVVDTELHAGNIPASWQDGILAALGELWTALFKIDDWNPHSGWHAASDGHNQFRSAYLLALMLLSHVPESHWLRIADIHDWLGKHHPASKNDGAWLGTFLAGVLFHLRAVEFCVPKATSAGRKRSAEDNPHDVADALVRLSPTGRWLLGLADAPAIPPVFPRTLLVQPNLEMIVYRQGLTPELIARLSRFAVWKTQGAACTLQLGPETVYRALETGLDFDAIVQTLDQHGTRPMPPAVVEMLRTWSNKRERLSVYASAAILEFTRPEDLEQSLARGLEAIRLTDRLALVPNESHIDYSHFRLLGTRDYGLPPEPCVEVAEDGVTLNVDLARSDLMLDAELQRFAEPTPAAAIAGRKQFRVTPASLAAAHAAGFSLAALDNWFLQRTGEPASAAARLLMAAAERATASESSSPPRDGTLHLRRLLVLQVPDESLADGLVQWPDTRRLIHERLGPTALAVNADDVPALTAKLQQLGIPLSAEAREPG